MRMPFVEFLLSGDPKFIVAFLLFLGIALFHFTKKLSATETAIVDRHNSKVQAAGFWVLVLSVLSLLIGFMHGLYFMSQAGNVAPSVIFLGFAKALVTPVLGLGIYIICNILKRISNTKTGEA